MRRRELCDLIDQCCAALEANDIWKFPLADDAIYAENCVEFPFGDGAWQTTTGLGEYQWTLADPQTGQAARFGVLDESGDKALFVMRIAVDGSKAITEMELLVGRPTDAGVPFLTADIKQRPELIDEIPEKSRVDRDEMLKLANGYFDTLQRNNGVIHTRFHEDCNRRENGVYTTNNPRPDLAAVAQLGCEEQFRQGFYNFDNWIRARRFPLVDEEMGVVLAGGFIDHDGQTREYTLTNGETRMGFFLRPHSFAFLEAFKIRDDKISAVESVFHFVPYRMRSPWADDEVDPRLSEAGLN